VHILDGEAVVVGNIGVAGIKGFGGGFDNHMLSMFGEEPMKDFVKEAVNEALSLDRALNRLDQDYENIKKIVLMHYAPVTGTIIGEPEQVYPFLGCSRLAEPLKRGEILAVFHGHAHKGVMETETETGLKVYNVSRSVLMRSNMVLPVFILEI
jgi:Icc-related predicted phosphoesterase